MCNTTQFTQVLYAQQPGKPQSNQNMISNRYTPSLTLYCLLSLTNSDHLR